MRSCLSEHWLLALGMTLCLIWANSAWADPIKSKHPQQDSKSAAKAPAVIGYVPGYRLDTEQLDSLWIKPVTDLIYFSVTIPTDGMIKLDAIPKKHLKKLNAMRGKSGRRLLVCVGGWNRSGGFAAAVATQLKRKRLINSLLIICSKHGFDGVDFDWEFPKPGKEAQNYSALLSETAEQFHKKGLIVTVALGGFQDIGRRAYQAVDRVHLMCYDQDFPHATLEHATNEVASLIKRGCPSGKIALGLPFYGRNKDRKTKTYAELIQGKRVPETSNLIDGFAFNGPDLIQRKTRFAVQKKLAGVMIWELSQDEPKQQPLLRAVASGLAKPKD